MELDIQRSLGRIEGKQDMMLAEIAEIKKAHGNIDSRIGLLENSKSYFFGVAGGVGLIFGALGSLFSKITGVH